MRIRAQLVAGTVLIGCAFAAQPDAVEAQGDSELYGGWIITDWQWPEGVDQPTPRRGLFLFTESGHYSMMFVMGEARAALPDDPTDAQIAAAYGPFVANSGRYSVSGNTISYEAYVAKDPEYMSQFAPTDGEGNEQTLTFEIADGTLTLGFGDGGPAQQARATLRRPGAPD